MTTHSPHTFTYINSLEAQTGLAYRAQQIDAELRELVNTGGLLASLVVLSRSPAVVVAVGQAGPVDSGR